jgi:hypothetical protein
MNVERDELTGNQLKRCTEFIPIIAHPAIFVLEKGEEKF